VQYIFRNIEAVVDVRLSPHDRPDDRTIGGRSTRFGFEMNGPARHRS
jgi:hypothetical protein